MRDIERLYKLLGENIYQARTKKGWTTEEFRLKLHPICTLSRPSLTQIELGKQRLMLHDLYRISDILGIKITDLLPK